MKITIDGPAASGKSTLAKLISKRLKVPYLETGSVYRAVAFILSKEDITVSGETAIEVLERRPFEIIMDIGDMKIIYNDEDIKDKLGDEETGRNASIIASYPTFKEEINRFFREIVKGQAVVEGRDAGLYIFPEAEIKFFITASPEERAERRWKQLMEEGKEINYEEILESIKERDERDSKRERYPFRPAEDAIVIDTTGRRVEEVFTLMLKEILSRCK